MAGYAILYYRSLKNLSYDDPYILYKHVFLVIIGILNINLVPSRS